MMSFEECYELAYQDLQERNLNAVLDSEPAASSLLTYSKKTGYCIDMIRAKAESDPIVKVLLFIKDPKKQNVGEIAWKLLMPEYEKLRSMGEDAVYLHKGQILSGIKSAPTGATKSLDFRGLPPHTKRPVYVCQKHTEGEGGAQDNQAKDVELFIIEANKIATNEAFVACLDGSYFDAAEVRRFQTLAGPNVYVCTANEFRKLQDNNQL